MKFEGGSELSIKECPGRISVTRNRKPLIAESDLNAEAVDAVCSAARSAICLSNSKASI